MARQLQLSLLKREFDMSASMSATRASAASVERCCPTIPLILSMESQSDIPLVASGG